MEIQIVVLNDLRRDFSECDFSGQRGNSSPELCERVLERVGDDYPDTTVENFNSHFYANHSFKRLKRGFVVLMWS